MRKLLLGIGLAAGLLFGTSAYADSQLTFTWNANAESDLAGYRLYKSDTSGNYTLGMGNEVLDIPAGTETGNVIVADGVWHFVLTAYDGYGNESLPSQEVITTNLDTTAPESPIQFNITITINVP